MSLGVQDPIRNALRDLVRDKVLVGWQAYPQTDGSTKFLMVPSHGRSHGLRSASETNDLIAMYWEDAA